tara:strand:- start:78099 stop:78425 length:327 start_codon:yes stop_codon:yes gene_type:complete
MKSIEKVQLGSAIRALRKASGHTQVTLSKNAKVKQSTVSRWERGIDVPSFDHMNRLAQIFDCTYYDLMAASNNSSVNQFEITHTFKKLNQQQQSALLGIAKIMLNEKV